MGKLRFVHSRVFRPFYTFTRDNADILAAIPHENYDKRLLGETLIPRLRYVQVTLFLRDRINAFGRVISAKQRISKIAIYTRYLKRIYMIHSW